MFKNERNYFRKKAPSHMFDWVLNKPKEKHQIRSNNQREIF